jgi:hypothetical protein
VFGVEIEGCARCGGKLKIIASIEEPAIIAKILAHLEKAASEGSRPELVPQAARAPPAQSRLLTGDDESACKASKRMKEAERAIRAKIRGFRAGPRMTREQVHERKT